MSRAMLPRSLRASLVKAFLETIPRGSPSPSLSSPSSRPLHDQAFPAPFHPLPSTPNQQHVGTPRPDAEVTSAQVDSLHASRAQGSREAGRAKVSSRKLGSSRTRSGTERIEVRTPLGQTLHVTVTREGNVAEEWLQQHAREGVVPRGAGGATCLLGMDIETRPTFVKGDYYPAALLQLSTASHCLVVQLLHSDFFPRDLRQLFKSEGVSLAGEAVSCDMRKLSVDHHLLRGDCGAELVELTPLARRKGLGNGKGGCMGLKVLTSLVLDEALVKSGKMSRSRWDLVDLSVRQVEYAVMDAWISYRICEKLLTMEDARAPAQTPAPLVVSSLP